MNGLNNIFFATLGLLLLLSGASYAMNSAGRVTLVQGRAQATAASGVVRVLSPGDLLFAGEQVSTANAARVKISLVDGSVIALGAASQVTIDRAETATGGGLSGGFSQLRGIFYGVFRRIAAGGSSIDIRSTSATAGIRGTSLLITADDKETSLYVLSGAVAFSQNDSPEANVMVLDKMTSTIAPPNAPSAPKPFTLDSIQGKLADVGASPQDATAPVAPRDQIVVTVSPNDLVTGKQAEKALQILLRLVEEQKRQEFLLGLKLLAQETDPEILPEQPVPYVEDHTDQTYKVPLSPFIPGQEYPQ